MIQCKADNRTEKGGSSFINSVYVKVWVNGGKLCGTKNTLQITKIDFVY